jgi:glycosyltransferase involved in cell wall biosynthesis
MYEKAKTCAIIPFFNEQTSIREVVEKTKYYVDCIIGVNDGSTDDSEERIKNIDNVLLISFSENKGKGFAIRKAFEKAIELDYDYFLILDADLQHPPELIPGLVGLLNDYDIVCGNRMNNTGRMPIQRILSNRLTSLLLSLKTGIDITDSQCGFRAFKKEVIPKLIPGNNGYEAESEILILAARNNFKIGFFEIPSVYENETSKMQPVKTILGFIKTLFM